MDSKAKHVTLVNYNYLPSGESAFRLGHDDVGMSRIEYMYSVIVSGIVGLRQL